MEAQEFSSIYRIHLGPRYTRITDSSSKIQKRE